MLRELNENFTCTAYLANKWYGRIWCLLSYIPYVSRINCVKILTEDRKANPIICFAPIFVH